jgi:hypothetical protein
MPDRTRLRRRACAAGVLCILPIAAAATAAPTQIRAGNRELASVARSVGKGAQLRIKGLALRGETEDSTLELERFDVWRPDAVIEIDGQQATPPATAYFRGHVAGEDGSVAVVSVRESGEVQGVVQKHGKTWLVGKGRSQRALHSRSADDEALPPFECANDQVFSAEQLLGVTDAPAPAALTSGTVLDQPRVANIAIETDYEFYAKFGNTTAALDYIADLIGYADVTYSREVDTDMQIGFSRLWTGGASSDPWTASTCVDSNGDGTADNQPCGTSGALTQFRTYWNANMTGVNRTVAHMLSGKSLGGGIAYVGVLCQNYSSAKGSTNDYGVSASLGGAFSWDGDQTHKPSNVVWDIVVVQHEIGHNFNSPHAHDYCNIGSSAMPIDNCYAGCQAGATVALPSCSSPTPHFTSGSGAGTIMSYCHLRSGGYGNIAMTFGENHTCGTQPAREATRMAAHVASKAATYPTCFAGPTCGNGILDPGEQCDGINLGGATCSASGFFGGTLTCSSTCTLNTSKCSNCGNNILNAGEVCDGSALGTASCSQQGCTSGGILTCNSTCTAFSTASCLGCPVCDRDGVCESGETCTGCPNDCATGTFAGSRCGNGICEAGNGEDCLSCPSDCNGVQSGKTSARYCCGDGAGQNPKTCTDSRCTIAKQCTTVKKTASSYCCGNATCEAGENCSTCKLDCSGAAEVCGNSLDDNCNAQIDCSDSSCSSLASCACKSRGSACTANSQCCSGSCQTGGSNPYTCY